MWRLKFNHRIKCFNTFTSNIKNIIGFAGFCCSPQSRFFFAFFTSSSSLSLCVPGLLLLFLDVVRFSIKINPNFLIFCTSHYATEVADSRGGAEWTENRARTLWKKYLVCDFVINLRSSATWNIQQANNAFSPFASRKMRTQFFIAQFAWKREILARSKDIELIRCLPPRDTILHGTSTPSLSQIIHFFLHYQQQIIFFFSLSLICIFVKFKLIFLTQWAPICCVQHINANKKKFTLPSSQLRSCREAAAKKNERRQNKTSQQHNKKMCLKRLL